MPSAHSAASHRYPVRSVRLDAGASRPAPSSGTSSAQPASAPSSHPWRPPSPKSPRWSLRSSPSSRSSLHMRYTATITTRLPLSAQMTITPITSSGNIHSATISADGKWLAYIQDEKNGHGVWVRQLGTGSTAQVVPGTPGEIFGIVFSLDGNYLYYNKATSGESGQHAFQSSVSRRQRRRKFWSISIPRSVFRRTARRFVFGRQAPQPKTSSAADRQCRWLRRKAFA